MKITGIILSGGRATRMGGVDKGLVTLANKSLVQHVITRLETQVDEILISANRELPYYRTLGYQVMQDAHDGFIGPLAGVYLGLRHSSHDYVLTVPCDSPLLPLDLAPRLMAGLLEKNAEIAIACSEGRAHPVFCLCKKNTLAYLEEYLAKGGRKVNAWQKSLNYIEVDFSDVNESFINLNTAEDLATLALKLSHA